MSTLTSVSVLTPKVNGAVPEGIMAAIDEIVVDSSLHLPDMFMIRLQDSKLSWVDHADFDFGKKVEIGAKAAVSIGGGSGTLIAGEITAIEPDFSATGVNMLIIRGYDQSNRLHFNKQSRTFANQTDSDIARTIADDAGLTPDIDTTSVKYEYVMQNNQTNIEFLAERASRIGFQVFSMEGKLYFKKGDFVLPGQAPELTLGEELRSFRPRMTVAGQASKVRVMGWDAQGKKSVKGEAVPTDLKPGGAKKTGGASAKSAFGNNELWAVLSNYPVATVTEAQALADGLAHDISTNFMEAEGVAYGNPAIKAGMKVDLKGLGERFSGKYFVTSATHIHNAEGYETHFTVSGRQPNTFNHLLEQRHHNGSEIGRINGVVVGLVTNLNDTLGLGRVKVKFPWLIDGKNTEIESAWAKIAAPGGGADNRGFYYPPEINDEVLLAFEYGDVNRPYIVGGLWNNTDKPPTFKGPTGAGGEAVQDGKTIYRIIQSKTGHRIILDDGDQPAMLIIDASGKDYILIDSDGNNMDIKVGKDLNIEAGGNINMKAGGTITMEATKDIIEKAKGMFTVEATRSASVTANQDLKLNGKLTAKMEGGSTTDVKGGVAVNIDGGATTNITGGIIKLN